MTPAAREKRRIAKLRRRARDRDVGGFAHLNAPPQRRPVERQRVEDEYFADFGHTPWWSTGTPDEPCYAYRAPCRCSRCDPVRHDTAREVARIRAIDALRAVLWDLID